LAWHLQILADGSKIYKKNILHEKIDNNLANKSKAFYSIKNN